MGLQIENFTLICCPFTWPFTRPNKMLPLTIKSSKNNLYLTFIKVSPDTKCVPYFILKLTMKRNKQNCSTIFLVKKSVRHFRKKNFFFTIGLWCIRKVSANFRNKYVIFGKCKICRFSELNSYSQSIAMGPFSKIAKKWKSLHPTADAPLLTFF